jgi:uncharacterized membrane protein YkoI
MKIRQKIAVEFLQHHHSGGRVEKAAIEDGVWVVQVLISSPKSRKFKVKINAKTGYVLGWQ